MLQIVKNISVDSALFVLKAVKEALCKQKLTELFLKNEIHLQLIFKKYI